MVHIHIHKHGNKNIQKILVIILRDVMRYLEWELALFKDFVAIILEVIFTLWSCKKFSS